MRNVAGYHRGVSKTTSSAITGLPTSPDDERRARMIRYAVAMGIRMVCIGACFIAPGWWILIPAFGAIVLPYFAVIAANTVVASPRTTVERPGAILLVDNRPTSSGSA
jgi:Protein of unknown function (DUF3099)